MLGNQISNSPSIIIGATHWVDDVEFGPFYVWTLHDKEEQFEQGVLSDLIILIFEFIFNLRSQLGLESEQIVGGGGPWYLNDIGEGFLEKRIHNYSYYYLFYIFH